MRILRFEIKFKLLPREPKPITGRESEKNFNKIIKLCGRMSSRHLRDMESYIHELLRAENEIKNPK